ncbi:MAG TPA: tetratricopeptide repeat protein [Myxococcota bacterium]|nr:tetratricopeptide repeat protein [Myxococcota bacterium]
MISRHITLASVLLAACCLYSVQAPADDDRLSDSLARIQAISRRGADALALDLYLHELGRIDSARPDERAAFLKGLLLTCIRLAEHDANEPALRGLVALLPATGGKDAGPGAVGTGARLALQRLCVDLILAHQPGLAVTGLEALLADGPGDAMRWALLVRALVESGDVDKAKDTLKRALSLYPAAPELFFARATLAGALSRDAVIHSNFARASMLLLGAVRDLEKSVAHEPRIASIRRALGKIRSSLWTYYRSTGHYQKAIEMLQAAEDAYGDATFLDPLNPEIPLELGRMLFAASDWIAAANWFDLAHRRYLALAHNKKLSAVARKDIHKNTDRCLHNLAATYHNRALDAHNTAQFARARELVRQAARLVPAYAAQSQKLLGFLARSQVDFKRRKEKLENEPESVGAQVALGDLLMQARDYSGARKAFKRAGALPAGTFTPAQIAERVYDTRLLDTSSRRIDLPLGSVQAELEIPKDFDPSEILDLLQRANALSMAFFPNRLNGPVDVKIFPNRRAFIEQAGPRINTRQLGGCAYGRLLVFDAPGRPRAKWIEILVHEIAHRYVDELSFSNAPRWLSEGIALRASREWTPSDGRRLYALSENGHLAPWNDLDRRLDQDWNDPASVEAIYLQSESIVRWLIKRFDFQHLFVLLAVMRAGAPLDVAIQQVYGLPLVKLEKNWRDQIE